MTEMCTWFNFLFYYLINTVKLIMPSFWESWDFWGWCGKRRHKLSWFKTTKINVRRVWNFKILWWNWWKLLLGVRTKERIKVRLIKCCTCEGQRQVGATGVCLKRSHLNEIWQELGGLRTAAVKRCINPHCEGTSTSKIASMSWIFWISDSEEELPASHLISCDLGFGHTAIKTFIYNNMI